MPPTPGVPSFAVIPGAQVHRVLDGHGTRKWSG